MKINSKPKTPNPKHFHAAFYCKSLSLRFRTVNENEKIISLYLCPVSQPDA